MIPRSLQRLRVVLHQLKMSRNFSNHSADEVLFNAQSDKRIIILNRPKALNALNLNMIRQIYPKMVEWETDPGVSMVMMKATGVKAFCAGGDIRAVTEAGKVGDSLANDFFKEEYMLNYKIGSYKKPYIAVIDGITMGGGVGLSVHGRYRVATERTVFAMPETGIGLFPDVGGGHFLPWLEGRLGTYLAMTGYRLKGRDVFLAGVASHFVDSDKLPTLEQSLMEMPDVSDLNMKKLLDDFQGQSTVDSDKPFVLAPHMDNINAAFGYDSVEEIFKHLQEDPSEWAKKQLDTLLRMSPTSMKITLRQLRMGETMSLAEILKMEYRLSQRCIEDHDFYEGVRAVLVDKDQRPSWKPDTLEGVTPEKVDWYFSHLPPERELEL